MKKIILYGLVVLNFSLASADTEFNKSNSELAAQINDYAVDYEFQLVATLQNWF